jgi:ADP-dependent NAD(P)H-hydrate dehydratase / NAD(P)H-hydrate epimerase
MWLSNAAQIREMDRLMTDDFAYPSLLLMETAGRLTAERILQLYPDLQKFLIPCGPGNNGGDGMVIARYLHQAGRKVWVIFSRTPEAYADDAMVNYQILRKANVPNDIFARSIKGKIEEYLHDNTVIVDALLGTGVWQELREQMAQQLEFYRKFRNSVVAVDLPSGLSADTGVILNVPMHAEHTITFQLPKICHYVTPAADLCGQIHVVDIGIYREILEQVKPEAFVIDDDLVRAWYRPRSAETHKGTFGHCLLAGGSRGKGGAIALASQSTLEIGAGLCTAFIPGSVSCSFHRNTLENMSVAYGKESAAFLSGTAADVFNSYFADKNVLVVGPGLGANDDTHDFLAGVLERCKLPLVLDADALNLLARSPELLAKVPEGSVLTPHPGEMSRLVNTSGEAVQGHRFEIAKNFAIEHKVYLVLKGRNTLIATPEGRVYVNPLGNPGMATAGTGDVLAGTIGGLIAQGYPIEHAAVIGTYVHAKAGDRVASKHGMEGVVASKVMRSLGIALNEIVQAKAPIA